MQLNSKYIYDIFRHKIYIHTYTYTDALLKFSENLGENISYSLKDWNFWFFSLFFNIIGFH